MLKIYAEFKWYIVNWNTVITVFLLYSVEHIVEILLVPTIMIIIVAAARSIHFFLFTDTIPCDLWLDGAAAGSYVALVD